MTDTTLNRFISSGTHAQRLAFTPVQATPGSGPSPSAIWFETDTGDTYMWNFGGSVWTKIDIGGGGGGGGSNYKGYQEPMSTHTAGSPGLTQGNWGGRSIILDEACTLNSMVFWGINAAPTATVQAAFYANTAGIPASLLASSAVVTGVTVGLNIIPLTTPLVVTQGQALWVGAVVEVVPIFTSDASGRNAAFFATAGPAPATAPACSYGTHPEINFWASK